MAERYIATTALDATTHRRILLTLSLDDDAIVAEVKGRGPILLCADDDAHKRLRELALDASIPQYKGDTSGSGIGNWFAEIGRQISELGDDGDETPRALPTVRRIAIALTYDGGHLLVEAPPHGPMRLRDAPGVAYARLRELVGDDSIPDVRAGALNARSFFRGAGRAIGELAKDDK